MRPGCRCVAAHPTSPNRILLLLDWNQTAHPSGKQTEQRRRNKPSHGDLPYHSGETSLHSPPNMGADFPPGTLTAVVGGSGSGKVCVHCTNGVPSHVWPPPIDDLPQRSLQSHAGIELHHCWKYTILRIPRPSYNDQRLCYQTDVSPLRRILSTPISRHFSAA